MNGNQVVGPPGVSVLETQSTPATNCGASHRVTHAGPDSPRWCSQCGEPLVIDLTNSAVAPDAAGIGAGVAARFDDAVFISFTHLDNQPAGPTKQQWINEFYEHLKIRLAELFGDEVGVFKDERLRGNDTLQEALRARLQRAAVLVSICSPRYLKSEWCQWELNEFTAAAEAGPGLAIGSQSRVFKAVKTPVPLGDLPEPLAACIGYEFFEKGEGESRIREYLRNPSEQERWKFYAKVDDVAEDVAELLEGLGYDPNEPASGADGTGVTVFLAEAATDATPHRDDLKRELERRGHRVLPDHPLPLDVDELDEVLASFLDRADFSIHPLGGRYGPRPDGDDRSMPHLQLEACRQRAEAGELVQLIWIPDDVEAAPAQQALLNHVETMEVGSSTEVVRTPLSLFKAHAFEVLTPPEPAPAALEPVDGTRVYLVYDGPDQTEAQLVRQNLEALGFIVDVPLMDGSETEVREIHEMSMVLCDAVVIFHGTATEHWVRLKLFDLVKARGWGRTEPFQAKAVLLGQPATAAKAAYATNDALVLDATTGDVVSALRSFVSQLAQGASDA